MEHDIYFKGGADSDSDIRDIRVGDYRVCVHLRNGSIEASHEGTKETYSGNLLRNNTGLPAGTNIVLNAVPNVEAGAIMFFVFNSNGDHTIWLWNITTQGFTKVLQSAVLGFVSTDYFYNGNVVNNLLYWSQGRFTSYINDNFQPPRKINISKAIAFTLGLPGGYSVVNFQTLDMIKYPPLFGPDVVYNTDTNQETNFLWGKLYKFRYRYYYDDFESSVFSPYSVLPLPTQSDFAQGRNFINTKADNVLEITLLTGPDIVTKIEVAVQISGGAWFTLKLIDKAAEGIGNNTTYTLSYYGNETLLSLPAVLDNYDRLPQTARCMEFISPTRQMVFGDFDEGFDLLTLDVDIECVAVEIPKPEYMSTPIQMVESGGTSYIYIGDPNFPQYADVFVEVGDTYQIYLGGIAISPPRIIYYTLTQTDVDNIRAAATATLRITELLDILAAYISSEVGAVGVVGTFSGGVAYEWVPAIFSTSNKVSNVYRPDNPYVGLFKGAVHEYGLQYYNRANQDSTVITVPTLSLFVPNEVQQDRTDFFDPQSPYYALARMTVNNLPPDYATHYRPVKRRVPVLSFQERTGVFIQNDPSVPGAYRISLDPFMISVNGGKLSHIPEKGDVVRLIRRASTQNVFLSPPGADFGDYCDQYIELEVLYYFEEGGTTNYGVTCEAISVRQFDYRTILGGFTGFILQIYKPAPKNDNAEWKEISDWYTITNPNTLNRAHAGSSITGTASDLVTGSPIFSLAAFLMDQPGANLEYLVGRQFTITSDVTYTGTIIAASFNPATQITTVTAGENYTGANTSGSVVIDLSQSLNPYIQISYNNLMGGAFAVGETITDSITGAMATIVGIAGINSLQAYLTTPTLAFGVGNNFDNGTGVSADVVTYTVTELGAVLNMLYGDVYTRLRQMSSGYGGNNPSPFYPSAGYYPIDDFSLSDYYPSKINGDGRTVFEVAEARKVRQKATVIHGGSYIDNTFANNLSRFVLSDVDNTIAMDESYGTINKLVMIGFTLKALQDRKENSIYIQRIITTSGDSPLTPSSKTFNQNGWRPYDTLFGTINPGSVQVYVDDLYYYDFYSSTVVRSLNNGQQDLCAGTYFYNSRINTFKANYLSGSGRADKLITSAIDERNGEYILYCVNRTNGAFVDGLVFNFNRNRWDHEVLYAPIVTGRLGETLVSFPGTTANLYQHNAGAENSFFGTVRTSSIDIPFNALPDDMKQLLALCVRSNQLWNCPLVDIPANASYTTMNSQIPAALFRLLEGYYYAEFKRDQTNVVPSIPKIANATLALQNGRALRGYGAMIRLTYTPGSKAVLSSVCVTFTPSRPNPK